MKENQYINLADYRRGKTNRKRGMFELQNKSFRFIGWWTFTSFVVITFTAVWIATR